MKPKRILPLLFCILLLLFSVLPVMAAETGSVTILFRHENKPVAGCAFEIYKAAEWNGGGYSLVAPFSDYSVKLSDDPTSEEWKTLASTLAAYAARDPLSPLASGQTDAAGELRFENLSDGLYLLIGRTATLEDVLLFPQPMLVSVPYAGTDGTKDYEVLTEPKYESQTITAETVSRRVLKVWKDEGNESDRPAQITVQLLCDGKVYDEQTLNEANNWQYTWENLNAEHTWQLTEKTVPEDYTVQITRQDMTFIVKNTNGNPPPPPPPDLPQTGLLWWPVPILAGIGAVSLFFGIFLLLKKGKKKGA